MKRLPIKGSPIRPEGLAIYAYCPDCGRHYVLEPLDESLKFYKQFTYRLLPAPWQPRTEKPDA